MHTVERGENLKDEFFQQSPSRTLSNNSTILKNSSPSRQNSSNKKIPIPLLEPTVVYPGLVGKNILTPRSNMMLLKTLEAEGLFQ